MDDLMEVLVLLLLLDELFCCSTCLFISDSCACLAATCCLPALLDEDREQVDEDELVSDEDEIRRSLSEAINWERNLDISSSILAISSWNFSLIESNSCSIRLVSERKTGTFLSWAILIGAQS